MCGHVRDDQAATQSQVIDLSQLGKLAVVYNQLSASALVCADVL